MRYALIRQMDISNGKGVGISLFVQGCHFHCKGCFNPETWDFNKGKEWTKEIEDQFIKLAENHYITRISILGGEPFAPENRDSVIGLCKKLKEKYPNKTIWIYTGYTLEHLDFPLDFGVDILVDGQFEADKSDIRLKFRGSINQRLIDVKETLKQNKIVTIQN